MRSARPKRHSGPSPVARWSEVLVVEGGSREGQGGEALDDAEVQKECRRAGPQTEGRTVSSARGRQNTAGVFSAAQYPPRVQSEWFPVAQARRGDPRVFRAFWNRGRPGKLRGVRVLSEAVGDTKTHARHCRRGSKGAESRAGRGVQGKRVHLSSGRQLSVPQLCQSPQGPRGGEGVCRWKSRVWDGVVVARGVARCQDDRQAKKRARSHIGTRREIGLFCRGCCWG